ncbi:hypothetical protein [Segnochrobactrum spirostomi]|uniref:Ca-activated chloride channel family protein n=1 Tax=Segnochrobactrum spirostomi TaxID=2608987 RepID=A0A6A7YC09_9HYPH|nr:hypothetical protein [Segnochrobactrum spirostomi]MQT14949.1 hypothetical protein [Segnochrobactrum spirostomi]
MNRIAIVAVAGLAVFAFAGPAAWGRLALWAGAPAIAAGLLADDGARGLALYRSGDYAAADAAFAAAGRSQTFNRALSLAATGDYRLAVAYLDAVLFANPADSEARRVRDLIDPLVPKPESGSVARGRMPAQGGPGPTGAATGGALASTPDPTWKRPLEARGFAASDAWLDTLPDDPGAFLRARLEKDFERRAALGLVRPDERDQW